MRRSRGARRALQGKVAVATGASKGIGLAITQALVEEGVHVVAGSRRSTPELKELGGRGSVQAIEVDLATAAGPAHLIAAALAHGRLDILVNNVGAVAPRLTGFLDITDEQWLQSLTLNLMAAIPEDSPKPFVRFLTTGKSPTRRPPKRPNR